jgi:hypothetical protein
MPKFYAKTPIKFGGERYAEGEPIELSDKQAKPLLATGAISTEAPARAEDVEAKPDAKKNK